MFLKVFKYFKNIILRPLFVFSLLFFTLASVLFVSGLIIKIILSVVGLIILVLGIVMLFLRGNDVRKKAFYTFLISASSAVLIASVFSIIVFNVYIGSFQSYDNLSASFSGTVTDVKYEANYGSYYIVDVENIEGKSVKVKASVFGPYGFEENDTVNGTATFKYVLNDDSDIYEYRQSYISDGVLLSAEADSLDYTGSAHDNVISLAKKLNNKLSTKLLNDMGEENGGFASALFLGNKTNLSDRITRNFKRLGISHVLALSGMHLAVICSLVSLLFRPFGTKVRRIASIIIVVFYMFLTGFSPSVTRAGIMVIIMSLASLFKRETDSYTSLGVALILITAVNPFSVCDIGLQLSAMAVLAILLIVDKKRPVEAKDSKRKSLVSKTFLKIFKYIASAFGITVSVVLFMLPLEWLYFARVSYLSPLTSFIFSIGATLLLWLIPFQLIFSFIPAVSAFISGVSSFIIGHIITLSEKLATLHGITLYLKFTGGIVICLLIFASFILFAVLPKKQKFAPLIAGVLLFASLIVLSNHNIGNSYSTTTLSTVNNKTNDAVIVYDSGKSAIIDVGNGYSSVFRLSEKRLEELGIDETDVIVLTHLHSSYVSTLSKYFDKYVIRSLYIPNTDDYECERLEDLCKRKGVNAYRYNLGEEISIGNSSVITHDYSFIKRSVQPIIELDIKVYDKTFTYIGSSYNEAEKRIAADIIWYGTHGPKYKSNFDVKEDYVLYPLYSEFANKNEFVPSYIYLTKNELEVVK